VSVSRGEDSRRVRASAVPISIDYVGLEAVAKQPETVQRAKEIRESLGNPRTLLLGVDRLDYTKGIGHRIKAYGELLEEGQVSPPNEVFVQVATPSRERVAAYRELRQEIEGEVGRLNGEHSRIGAPAVHYLHHSYPRQEMAALFLAADVVLVTPLRDGMNLVAKEYVTCRYDEGGALVLSEFTGAFHELHQAFVCNPHDIEGLKQTIMRAIETPDKEKKRLMRAMRRRVADHDVQRWASRFLEALAVAPERPQRTSKEQKADEEHATADRKARYLHEAAAPETS
jgi:trehalose 6-phosphate synthase